MIRTGQFSASNQYHFASKVWYCQIAIIFARAEVSPLFWGTYSARVTGKSNLIGKK